MSASDVDDLYAMPLDEFTKARNALAKSSGDKSIAKLKKPSAAAWALNQAARKSKGDVARFLHSAAIVRTKPTREALDELRATEADVRRAAVSALGDRGDAQVGALNSLIAAAAADESVAEVLRAGRLTGDEESGSTGFTGPVAPGKNKGRKKPEPPPKDEVRDARERRAREAARKKADEAAAEAREADREADRLEREAADAEERATKARRHAETARARADKAKAHAEVLREAARA